MTRSENAGALGPILAGRVAAVIGGGRGIGRATALKLASAGASVVVAARSASELEAVAVEAGAQGWQIKPKVVDVTNSATVQAMADELRGTHGRLDILVNSAGTALIAPFAATSETDWDLVVDTNLRGTYVCIHAMLDLLRASGRALVVNMASKVGLTGHAEVSAYSAAKAGVIGLTRALAQELSSSNIRVVAVCPGPVDTPMRWAATPKMDPNLTIPAERIADAILFLATLGEQTTLGGELVIEALGYDTASVSLD